MRSSWPVARTRVHPVRRGLPAAFVRCTDAHRGRAELIRARPHLGDLDPYEPGTPVAQLIEARGLTDAVNLALNECPFAPSGPVVAAITHAATGSNRYPEDTAPRLRAAIAARLGVTADQIVVGCGSVDVFQQLCLALLDPGDSVVCARNSFPEYWRTPNFLRATVHRVAMDSLTTDCAGLLAALDATTRLVVVANPNNPTGTVVDPGALKALLEGVPEGVCVLVDEAYVEFCDPGRRAPTLEWLAEHRNLVVSRTFSKALGIGGVRLGFVVADPAFLATLAKVHLPYSVSALAQAAGLAALTDEVLADVARRTEIVREGRRRMTAALTAAGWVLSDSQANFVFAPCDRAVEVGEWFLDRGVIVRAIPHNGVRVTVGTPGEVDRFLEVAAEWAGAHRASDYF